MSDGRSATANWCDGRVVCLEPTTCDYPDHRDQRKKTEPSCKCADAANASHDCKSGDALFSSQPKGPFVTTKSDFGATAKEQAFMDKLEMGVSPYERYEAALKAISYYESTEGRIARDALKR